MAAGCATFRAHGSPPSHSRFAGCLADLAHPVGTGGMLAPRPSGPSRNEMSLNAFPPLIRAAGRRGKVCDTSALGVS